MKTRLLGGIAALVVAIIGTVMLVFYVQGADKRALANTETEDVYVVQKEIPAGTPTAKFGDSVIKKSVPKAAIAADSVSNLGDLGSKVSSIDFKPGEQLLATRMVDPNSLAGPGRVEVPTGLQEVTVRLPIERVVGGHVAAGDTVGMMLSFKADDKTGAPDQTSFTFHKVLVTAVQDASGAISDNSGSAPQASGGSLNANKTAGANGGYLVTVARSAVDVQKIVYAAEFGTVYLSKEPSDAVAGATGTIDRGSVFK
ncbi:Flp pilus assembly protein CpaB [Arthrobacter sp. MMS24-S77]